MKLLPILLLVLFTLNCSKKISNTTKTSYYFCYSRHINQQENSELNYILLTDILKINKDELVIKEKSSKWYEFVKKRCKGPKGCTSDLMYYNSAQEAEANRYALLEIYKDTEKYKIEKVAFK